MNLPADTGYYWFRGRLTRTEQSVDMDELVYFMPGVNAPSMILVESGNEFHLATDNGIMEWVGRGDFYGPITYRNVQHLKLEP